MFLDVIQFLHNLMQKLLGIENIYHLQFSNLLFFFIHLGESIYELRRIKLT